MLVKKAGLGYMQVYRECVRELSCKISHTDFSSIIDNMIKEKLLHKDEDTNSKLKIKRVHYLLTESAKKKHELNILYRDEETKKRRNLYQILTFFEVFRSRNSATEK